MIHYLKTENKHFEKVWDHSKPFELRPNADRNFAEGDILILGDGVQEAKAERVVIARVESVTVPEECLSLAPGCVGLGLTILGRVHEDFELFEYQRRTLTSEQWTGRDKTKDSRHGGQWEVLAIGKIEAAGSSGGNSPKG